MSATKGVPELRSPLFVGCAGRDAVPQGSPEPKHTEGGNYFPEGSSASAPEDAPRPALPPPSISLTLSEEDVQQDFLTNLRAMHALRQEALSSRFSLEKEGLNDYLHLAYRLASSLNGLAEGEMRAALQELVGTFNQDPDLLDYDPRQEAFWQASHPAFCRTMDALLVHLTGDEYDGIAQEKHHLVQALKVLGAESLPLEKRLSVYDTVLPKTASDHTKWGGKLSALRERFWFFNNAPLLKTREAVEDYLATSRAQLAFRGHSQDAIRIIVPLEVFSKIEQA